MNIIFAAVPPLRHRIQWQSWPQAPKIARVPKDQSMSATGSMGALHMLCRPACLNVVWSDWQGFDWCVRLKVQEAFAGSQAPGLRRHREGCPSPRDRGGCTFQQLASTGTGGRCSAWQSAGHQPGPLSDYQEKMMARVVDQLHLDGGSFMRPLRR